MGETRNGASLAVGRVKEPKKRGYSGSTKRQKESPLCFIDGHLSSQNAELQQKLQKFQGHESYSEVTL